MPKKFIVTTILIFFMTQVPSTDLNAQVRSNSFNITLRLLLSKNTPTVTVAEARQQMGTALFLDAREPAEYQVSHLKDARFVGYDLFDINSMRSTDKNQPIVVYCTVGKRSENISKKLKEAGYTKVFNLYGGIVEWVNQGLPVYDPQGNSTNKVHTYTKFWGKWLDKGVRVH